MYLKILMKDLKRKKSMNIILFLFIFIATTFIAASISNISIISKGTDYFFEKAKLKDYIIITMDNQNSEISLENDNNIMEFLDENKNIKNYYKDEIIYFSEKDIKFISNNNQEKDYKLSSIGIISSIESQHQMFFDEKNNLITKLEKGYVYLNRNAFKERINKDDYIVINTKDGVEKKLKVIGYCKDALFGTDLMSSHRILINQEDFSEIQKSDMAQGKIYSVETANQKEFEREFNEETFNMLFSGNRNLIKATYIMDLVLAAVLMLVSICLILISIIMLKFTIRFTISEEFREIGIMKAIGIKDKSIRLLYCVKYFFLSILGSGLGFFVSIPFGRVLLDNVVKSIVTDNSMGKYMIQIISSLLVVFFVLLMSYLSTGKLKKTKPLDAIRNGNSGERFRRKGIIKLHRGRGKVTSFLAVNDILNESKKFLALMMTSIVGIWLVVMPANTINTLNSENTIVWFSLLKTDVFVIENERIQELVKSGKKEEYLKYIEETKIKLDEAKIKYNNISLEVMLKLKIRKDTISNNTVAMQGISTNSKDYLYIEGTPPIYENELAVTTVIAEEMGIEIGDECFITNGGIEKPYIVTALYQTMNNLGQGIRFCEKAELDYIDSNGSFGIQIDLTNQDEMLERDINTLREIYPQNTVKTAIEFLNSTIGGVLDQINNMKIYVLIVVIFINVMVVVLMQKMFLIKEKSEMGMLKALGFNNKTIILWQVKRISLVMILGISAGLLTSTLFTKITAGQVFKFMGASKIDFQIVKWEIFVLYPIVIFVATLIPCALTMLRVRKISPYETNNLE